MAITKTDYVLRSLSKVAHKRWELFAVSRIIHQLDDDIEFVTQQLVRGSDGQRYMTDLYFPQLGLHLEIDERYHLLQSGQDKFREMDIVQETDHEVIRLKTFDANGKETSLEELCTNIDAIVDAIHSRKQKKISDRQFTPWDWDARYSAETIIKRGYLDVADNVTFRVQVEALKCFGFKGKGWQKGAWNIPDGSGDWVWFPRLFPHFVWHNEMTPDGKHIYQRAKSDEARLHNQFQIKTDQAGKHANTIVFAKAKDSLGSNVLRYVGTFFQNNQMSSAEAIRFDRVRTREYIRK